MKSSGSANSGVLEAGDQAGVFGQFHEHWHPPSAIMARFVGNHASSWDCTFTTGHLPSSVYYSKNKTWGIAEIEVGSTPINTPEPGGILLPGVGVLCLAAGSVCITCDCCFTGLPVFQIKAKSARLPMRGCGYCHLGLPTSPVPSACPVPALRRLCDGLGCLQRLATFSRLLRSRRKLHPHKIDRTHQSPAQPDATGAARQGQRWPSGCSSMYGARWHASSE